MIYIWLVIGYYHHTFEKKNISGMPELLEYMSLYSNKYIIDRFDVEYLW